MYCILNICICVYQDLQCVYLGMTSVYGDISGVGWVGSTLVRNNESGHGSHTLRACWRSPAQWTFNKISKKILELILGPAA